MKRLLVVQFAGDYRAAWAQLQANRTESYYGHGYILEQLACISAELGQAGILCCQTAERYCETLPNGVVVMGEPGSPRRDVAAILGAISRFNPTHLVIAGPMTRLIRASIEVPGRRTACLFADSFESGILRRLLRSGRIAPLLAKPQIEWVANHGVNAGRSLVRIGVPAKKVLVWDFPHEFDPSDVPARILAGDGPHTLLFVGSLYRSKGVGDLIGAVHELRKQGFPVRLRVAGGGQLDRFRARAERLGIADVVEFLGVITNNEVIKEMREATTVIVPSRHSYPEGLPLTIYEALRCRTPIVASDHPMFAGHLVDGQSAVVFPAARPRAMAHAIVRLLSDAKLYARLSHAAPRTWKRMMVPLKWGDLLYRWVRDTAEDREWVGSHALAFTGAGSAGIESD